ncbi:ferroxidase fet3 [Coemansia aciculifera]|nr:ferroxidase fet3 [Coemansia aciculifera]
MLLLGALAGAARVVVNWDVGYVQVDRDGHIHNSLDVSTSIHAHGIFQNGTNYMDGTAMVTQCGIPPGQNFTYEYEADHAGTFWLHGHDHHQNSDGLRTPLVVRERKDPYHYEAEYVLSLEDWYQFEFATRLKNSLDPTDFPAAAQLSLCSV